MLNIRAWAEKYIPRLRAARAGTANQGDKDEESARPTEDAPLLSPAPSPTGRIEDDDWAHMYNFEIPSGSSEPYIPKQHHLSLKQKIKTRFHYYIPIFSWLPKYNVRQQLLSDVLAGVGVGAMLLPQALSYALLAGLPVVHGLLTAFVRIFFVECVFFFEFKWMVAEFEEEKCLKVREVAERAKVLTTVSCFAALSAYACCALGTLGDVLLLWY